MVSDNKTVLVLGADGQLGTDVRSVCREQSAVIGWDVADVDITDREALFPALDGLQPDMILNCAAYTQVDKCETDETAARRVNAEAPGYLAEWVAANGGYLLHISTDYVFDGQREPPAPYVETDTPAPQSAYGRGKLDGEQAILEKTSNALIMRTAWMYGQHGNNFLKTMLKLALREDRPAVRVVSDQWGCPTWSYRLAQQMHTAAEAGLTGIAHAVGLGHTTWYDLAVRFLELMGVPHNIRPCSTAEYPTPAVRPANSVLENRRLNEEGLCVMRPWQDDLKEFVEQVKDNWLNEPA